MVGLDSFLFRPIKIESPQFGVETQVKMCSILDEIAQANVESFLTFLVLFFSISFVIRFLSSFVLLLDPFFDLFFLLCLSTLFFFFFLLCLSFLRFFTFSFLSFLT